MVVKANRAVLAVLKPGESIVELQILAEKIILTGLRDLGLISGDIDEMIEARLPYLFMPHGMAHFIGIDPHDAGGYVKGCPERETRPGLK